MAVETVGQLVISKVTELLLDPTVLQFRYLFCYRTFLQELREQRDKLTLALDRVQNAVEVAGRNAEEIEIEVNNWLSAVNVEMEDMKRLENEIGKGGRCVNWCPNCIWQYNVSKSVAKKIRTTKKLEENSKKFQNVSHKVPLRDIGFFPSKDFMPSESSKEAFEQILTALKDDNINMIGLYGMGGLGKTTIVKEIGRRAKELKLCDQAVMVVVSQTPDIIKIQDQMADSLGLYFEERSKEGRASRLQQRLASEKTMLIILDDVWKYFDLKDVGIPSIDFYKGYKILLTTRLQHVCTSMNCQRTIPLKLLSETEAWTLFKVNAGLHDEDSALNNVAMEVMKECQGLPIAVVTVGRALRDKTAIEWEVASQQLKNSQLLDIEHIDEQLNAYVCLKLSYDYLKRMETKLCFLLCSLFPEDHEIHVEDLTRYALGFGLYQDVQSIEDARKQVYVAIENLKGCCLLMDTNNERCVKMHDLVRDVAIHIASQGEHVFMAKAGIGLKEWPRNIENYKDYTAISLMGNDIAEVPEGLTCPQLKILMLGKNHGSNLLVPDKFFEGLKAVHVLSLYGVFLSLRSLVSLTNLQYLELIGCDCSDLTFLRKLQSLKILSFRSSSIEELPDETGELAKLRLLDLTFCSRLVRIPVNLIGRLKNLEELYIGSISFKNWEVAGTSRKGMNASLEEVSSLSHLAMLSLNIPKVECIPRDFVFPKLHKYEIMLGQWPPPTEYPTSRKLSFNGIEATSLITNSFNQLFLNVCELSLYEVRGFKNIIPDLYQGSFEDLIVLRPYDCYQMECLIDTTEQQIVPATAFSNLKELYLDFTNLREICCGQPPEGFLQKLQKVEVNYCRGIRAIFPAKLRQALQNIMKLKVYWCDNLQEIFEIGGVDEGNEVLLSHLRTLELTHLPALNCIWKGPTRRVSLQSLVYLSLWGCPRLAFIFSLSMAKSLLQLETLEISCCYELEQVIRDKDDGEEIMPESPVFPKLTTVMITCCNKLEYVFPLFMAPSLLCLERLTISEVRQLKQVFGSGKGDAFITDGDHIVTFPQLKYLELWNLAKFCYFGPGNFATKLPSLQRLVIVGPDQLSNLLAQMQGLITLTDLVIGDCKGEHEFGCIWNGSSLKHLTTLEVTDCCRLKYIFPPSIFPSLPQLKSLKISGCEELEEIITRDIDGNDQILFESYLQSLSFSNLCEIQVGWCNKLKTLFPVAMAASLPQLQKLKVREAPKLMEVFGLDDKTACLSVEKEVWVPNLIELSLEHLPSLVRFSPAYYNFIFPCLKILRVIKCPKMATSFTPAADDVFIAKSETLIVDGSSNSYSRAAGASRAWSRDHGWDALSSIEGEGEREYTDVNDTADDGGGAPQV